MFFKDNGKNGRICTNSDNKRTDLKFLVKAISYNPVQQVKGMTLLSKSIIFKVEIVKKGSRSFYRLS